jgi:hypothetical protein
MLCYALKLIRQTTPPAYRITVMTLDGQKASRMHDRLEALPEIGIAAS